MWTSDRWRDEPQGRRVILVLSEREVDALSFRGGGAALLSNPEIAILPFGLQTSDSTVRDAVDRTLWRPGAVLIQSPFDSNAYANAVDAIGEFALEKFLHFSGLCRYLGAVSVTVEQGECTYMEDRKRMSLSADFSAGGGGGTIEQEQWRAVTSKLSLHDEFEGGTPDILSATEHLKRFGLSRDAAMRSLVDSRRDGHNLLTSRKIQLNLTSETRNNYRVLGSVSAPTYISLDAGYDHHVQKETEYTLTLKITF